MRASTNQMGKQTFNLKKYSALHIIVREKRQKEVDRQERERKKKTKDR